MSKRRQTFHLKFQEHELEIALDTGGRAGSIRRNRGLASSEADLPAAQPAVLALSGLLGLTEMEPRSYLKMTLRLGNSASG